METVEIDALDEVRVGHDEVLHGHPVHFIVLNDAADPQPAHAIADVVLLRQGPFINARGLDVTNPLVQYIQIRGGGRRSDLELD